MNSIIKLFAGSPLLVILAWALLAFGCASSRVQAGETSDQPAIPAPESEPEGEILDAASVRRVVEAGEHEVQACYQIWLDALVELDEIDSTPVLGGRLLVSLLVVSDGSVEEPAIEESDFDGASFERCVLAEVGSWRFPRTRNAPVAVELPFFFEPRRED